MFSGLDHVACLKIGTAYIFGLEKLEVSTLLGPQNLDLLYKVFINTNQCPLYIHTCLQSALNSVLNNKKPVTSQLMPSFPVSILTTDCNLV